MQIHFYKYQGTGNDFVILDAWNSLVEISKDQVEHLCNRKYGIGADGLMIIRRHQNYDFEMVYFNADGLPGSMCGNGGRCLVQFAFNKGYISNKTNFIAADGEHEALFDIHRNWVSLRMGNVKEVKLRDGGDCFVDTGSPHIVRWVEDPQVIDVLAEGKFIRNSIEFKQHGTNVNFVKVADSKLYIRTFERGVEDETLSCGTGVTASVIAASATQKFALDKNGCEVITCGGNLFVKFEKLGNEYKNIWLEGPAEFVFEGTIEII